MPLHAKSKTTAASARHTRASAPSPALRRTVPVPDDADKNATSVQSAAPPPTAHIEPTNGDSDEIMPQHPPPPPPLEDLEKTEEQLMLQALEASTQSQEPKNPSPAPKTPPIPNPLNDAQKKMIEEKKKQAMERKRLFNQRQGATSGSASPSTVSPLGARKVIQKGNGGSWAGIMARGTLAEHGGAIRFCQDCMRVFGQSVEEVSFCRLCKRVFTCRSCGRPK